MTAVSPGATDSAAGWQTEHQPDSLPEPLTVFCPAWTPGVQGFGTTDNSSLSELFKSFFDDNIVRIICDNTNKQAKKNIGKGKKFKWSDISPVDFCKFAEINGDSKAVTQYWRQKSFFSVFLFPASVMSTNAFQVISWNLHMSDPQEDAGNDQKKGTPEYDPLHRLRPLYDRLRNTCKAFYHPHQKVSIDERMVATKAKTEMRQYIKNKPTKWSIKLFVLADSCSVYTSDFTVYAGRSQFTAGHRLSYDSKRLSLYCDNFYTSPKLFKDLLSLKVHACGTYRDTRRETPTTKINAITRKSCRRTIRWIRNGPLLFTKWMDIREVTVCSTIHTVYPGETVRKSVKGTDGRSKCPHTNLGDRVQQAGWCRSLGPADPVLFSAP
ncbi:hypothetical protein LDENG_00103410 [Lucifuga dentata]|nr:hypothetical protein LDENG_00103410 [Lucifuga dentata]